ncbi:MAG: hypothetical protein ACE5KU_03055 [Nitrososphaerales archaeon]
MTVPRRSAGQKRIVRVEDVLIEELKHNTAVYSGSAPSSVDWERILKKTSSSPSKFYKKRVVEMGMLKEVIHILSRRRFDEARRVEVRKRASRKSWSTLYSLIFRDGEDTLGYAAIIYIPELSRDIEKSSGVIHAARYRVTSRGEDTKFERAKFDNYSMEVKPHIEILGNLYRRTRRL